MKLSLLILTLATFCEADPKEEIMLNNIAWIYAQFSLTFDPVMIASQPVNDASESLLPLYKYFKKNKEVIDNYKTVIDFFEPFHLVKIFPSFSINELNSQLDEKIKYYQNEIVTQDQTPCFIAIRFRACR